MAAPKADLRERTCVGTKANGERCKAYPIAGATVCRVHGGMTPQVKAKAAERVAAAKDDARKFMEEQLRPALLTRLAEIAESPDAADGDIIRACQMVLDRTGHGPQSELNVTGTINIAASVEWAEVRTVIIQALEPYPQARMAVASALAPALLPAGSDDVLDAVLVPEQTTPAGSSTCRHSHDKPCDVEDCRCGECWE